MGNFRKWLTTAAAGMLLACCTQGWAQDWPENAAPKGRVDAPDQLVLETQELSDQLAQQMADVAKRSAEMTAASASTAEMVRSAAAEAQKEIGQQTKVVVANLTEQAAQLEEQAQQEVAQIEAIAPEAIETQLAEMGIDGDQMSDGETGWAGVQVNEVDEQVMKELKLPAERGVVVESVEKESPAEKAGLRKNDVILQYDHQPVAGTVEFRRLVRETPPGRKMELGVWRRGQVMNVTLEVGDRGHAMETRFKTYNWTPDSARPKAFEFNFDMPRFMGMRPVLGITAEDLSGQFGSYFGAPDGEGVLVREVQKGTPAEKAGLKAGDVITKMNGKPVKSVRDLREGLQSGEEKKTVTLGLLRRGTSMTLTVLVEAPPEPERMDVIRRVSL